MVLVAALFLAACSPPPPAPTPDSPQAPTAPPTAAVAASATPAISSAASATPATQSLLPAPLYYLDAADDQIWLLDRDGTTKRQITFESLPIREFAAAGTTLVYLLESSPENGIVVLLGPGGRRELFNGPALAPRITPDAADIVFRISAPVAGLAIGQDTASTGIYRQGSSGGRPELLHADADGLELTPASLAPDGSRLLAYAIDGAAQTVQLAVSDRDQPSQLVLLDPLHCCDATWLADGSTLVVGSATLSINANEVRYAGLWLVDTNNGAATAIVEPVQSNDPAPADAFLQFSAPNLHPDGSISVFNAPGDYPLGSDLFQTLDRFSDSGERLVIGEEAFPLLTALWAPDGRGVVITRYVPGGAAAPLEFQPLLWIADDGATQIELADSGSALAWQLARPGDAANSCTTFDPLSFQPEAERRFDSNVADLQARLLARGYSAVGSVDGFFGEQTRAALQAFQSDNTLEPTGSLDCPSWQRLFL